MNITYFKWSEIDEQYLMDYWEYQRDEIENNRPETSLSIFPKKHWKKKNETIQNKLSDY